MEPFWGSSGTWVFGMKHECGSRRLLREELFERVPGMDMGGAATPRKFESHATVLSTSAEWQSVNETFNLGYERAWLIGSIWYC